jgi:hypothetical protein
LLVEVRCRSATTIETMLYEIMGIDGAPYPTPLITLDPSCSEPWL